MKPVNSQSSLSSKRKSEKRKSEKPPTAVTSSTTAITSIPSSKEVWTLGGGGGGAGVGEADEEASLLWAAAEAANLRRSDRIKTIETTRQANKELEIAEKLKKHYYGRNDSSSNITDVNESSQSPHDDVELAARLGCKRLSENESSTNMSSSSCSQTILLPDAAQAASLLSLSSPAQCGHETKRARTSDPIVMPADFQFPTDYHVIDHNVYIGKK